MLRMKHFSADGVLLRMSFLIELLGAVLFMGGVILLTITLVLALLHIGAQRHDDLLHALLASYGVGLGTVTIVLNGVFIRAIGHLIDACKP